MEITEVRMSISDNPQARLKAYASITFDHCFVVRNVKVVEGKNGLFVAMPSRKPKVSCQSCHAKNDATNRFCQACGAALAHSVATPGAGDLDAIESLAHRDIVHPITVEFRHYLQKTVLDAYDAQRADAATLHAQGAAGASV